MSFQDFLSHTSQIRGLLDSLENVASALIPGAAPVIAGIKTVEGPVLNTVAQLTGVAAQPQFHVVSLADTGTALFTGSRDDAEAWANSNMPSGFALIPAAPPPAS